MQFFEYFSLTEKKTQFNIAYKGKRVFSINKASLLNIIEDAFEGRIDEAPDDEIHREIGRLIKIYFEEKRKFYRNQKIGKNINIKHSSKEFKYFAEANDLCKKHGINHRSFMEAQIQGLSFARSGSGVFPSYSQICSDKAEDRILNYLQDNNPNKLTDEVLDKKDYTISLDQNKKFMNVVKKISDGTATLKEAKYAQKLLLIRKRKTSKRIEAYVEKLENGGY